MVVGDDQPHPQPGGILGLLYGGDAAVHRDHQPAALLMEPADGLPVQPVAFADAVGDIVFAGGALAAQVLDEHGGGRHAIHIVVAIYGDLLPRFQRPPDLPDCPVHIRQQKRIGQMGGRV